MFSFSPESGGMQNGLLLKLIICYLLLHFIYRICLHVCNSFRLLVFELLVL